MTKGELRELLGFGGLETLDKYYSIYEARVVEVDVLSNNRVKVLAPEIYSNDPYPEWVYPIGLPSSTNITVNIPIEKGETVYLVFRKGDLRFPNYFRKVSVPDFKGLKDKFKFDVEKSIFAAVYDTIIGVTTSNEFKVENKSKSVKLTPESCDITSQNSTPVPNVNGDTLRNQLDAILSATNDLNDNLKNLITSLDAFLIASQVVSVVVPPYTAALTGFQTSLIPIKVEVGKLTATLTKLKSEIPNNKSKTLNND